MPGELGVVTVSIRSDLALNFTDEDGIQLGRLIKERAERGTLTQMSEPPVEQATAAPGEKRTVRRG